MEEVYGNSTQLLTDKEYIDKIKVCIEICNEKYKDLANKGLVWDTIKTELRGLSISHASIKLN